MFDKCPSCDNVASIEIICNAEGKFIYDSHSNYKIDGINFVDKNDYVVTKFYLCEYCSSNEDKFYFSSHTDDLRYEKDNLALDASFYVSKEDFIGLSASYKQISQRMGDKYGLFYSLLRDDENIYELEINIDNVFILREFTINDVKNIFNIMLDKVLFDSGI